MVLTTVLSLATRYDLIPDSNHCPCAASLGCEEGGITLVKCFILHWSCNVRKLDTSSGMAGLVARLCFIGGNYLFTEFPLLSKNEPRWGSRALCTLFLGELVGLLEADRCTPFKCFHVWFISLLLVQGQQKIHAGGSFYQLLYLKLLK